MPRSRKRVNLLAETHEQLQGAYDTLSGFDLRALRGNPDLKEAIREARGLVEDAMVATGEAIRADQIPVSA